MVLSHQFGSSRYQTQYSGLLYYSGKEVLLLKYKVGSFENKAAQAVGQPTTRQFQWIKHKLRKKKINNEILTLQKCIWTGVLNLWL